MAEGVEAAGRRGGGGGGGGGGYCEYLTGSYSHLYKVKRPFYYLNFLDAINTTFSELTKRRMNNIITVCSAPMLDPDWSATLTADQSKTNHEVSQTPCDPHGCLHNTTKPRLN